VKSLELKHISKHLHRYIVKMKDLFYIPIRSLNILALFLFFGSLFNELQAKLYNFVVFLRVLLFHGFLSLIVLFRSINIFPIFQSDSLNILIHLIKGLLSLKK